MIYNSFTKCMKTINQTDHTMLVIAITACKIIHKLINKVGFFYNTDHFVFCSVPDRKINFCFLFSNNLTDYNCNYQHDKIQVIDVFNLKMKNIYLAITFHLLGNDNDPFSKISRDQHLVRPEFSVPILPSGSDRKSIRHYDLFFGKDSPWKIYKFVVQLQFPII